MSGGCRQEIRFGQSLQDTIVISLGFHGGILFLSVGFAKVFSGFSCGLPAVFLELAWFWRTGMTFQRCVVGILVLLVAALAGSFYMNWKTLGKLPTVKAFVEGAVFADAVAACERAQSTTPFKWTEGKQTAVIGVSSVKLNKDTIIPSYTL